MRKYTKSIATAIIASSLLSVGTTSVQATTPAVTSKNSINVKAPYFASTLLMGNNGKVMCYATINHLRPNIFPQRVTKVQCYVLFRGRWYTSPRGSKVAKVWFRNRVYHGHTYRYIVRVDVKDIYSSSIVVVDRRSDYTGE